MTTGHLLITAVTTATHLLACGGGRWEKRIPDAVVAVLWDLLPHTVAFRC